MPKCIDFEIFINLKFKYVDQKGSWTLLGEEQRKQRGNIGSAHTCIVSSSRSQAGVNVRITWSASRTQTAEHGPRVSGAFCVWGLRTGMKIKFPGDADAASPGSMLRESWRKSRIWVHSTDAYHHRGGFCSGKKLGEVTTRALRPCLANHAGHWHLSPFTLTVKHLCVSEGASLVAQR